MRRAFTDGLAPCVCEWCGVTFPRRSPKGRRPRFCSKAHINRAREYRQRDPTVIARRRACVCGHALSNHEPDTYVGPVHYWTCRYCDCPTYVARAA